MLGFQIDNLKWCSAFNILLCYAILSKKMHKIWNNANTPDLFKKKKKSWVTNQTDRWLHNGTSVAYMQAAFSTCPLQCFWAECCVAYMVILSFPIIKIFFMSSNRCDIGIYFSNFQSYSVFFVGVRLLLVSAIQHDESTVCVYIYPHPPPSHPVRWSPSTELSFLCLIAGSHWLSVWHMVVCVCQADLPVCPTLSPPCLHVCSLRLDLYSYCGNRFICTIFLDYTYMH